MSIKFKINLLVLIVLIILSACSQKQSHSSKYPNSNYSGSNYPSSKLESGIASFYADKYQGRQTANGERFNQNAPTAAHKTLKFGTRVKVTNTKNGRSVVVRINDRGPFVKGRIIDLSESSFRTIANPRSGLVEVTVEVLQ